MASGSMPLAGDDAPTRSPSTPATPPSRLAGNISDVDTSEPQGPDQGMQQLVQKLGDMLSSVMDIAQQYPAAASSLRQAEQGLRAAMRSIITSPGSPEPAAPQIGG